MKSMINVGNEIDAKEAVGPLGDALAKILVTIGEHRIDRETGMKALDILGMTAGIRNVTISGCNLHSEPAPTRRTTDYFDDE